jgi:DNA helicase-2/ATP-dependent DNA helicase PcrA
LRLEKKSRFLISGRKVKGFIDRIELTPEGEYIVVDFKTGYSGIPKNRVSAPLRQARLCHKHRRAYPTAGK